MKKILIYNWIPFDEKENKGGGVTVYTKNLVKYLAETADWKVCFLSSGRAYDIRRKETFIEPVENTLGYRCKCFQIVNSPVLSSAHLSFAYPWTVCEDTVLKKVVRQFFQEEGFAVVHFQNLEGLSLSVLELKEEFPGTKFLFSLHNYYPFCPQVMLWKGDQENCKEKKCGACCIGCMPGDVHRRKVVFNQWISYRKQKGIDSPFLEKVQRLLEKCYKGYDILAKGTMSEKKKVRLANAFERFRDDNVAYLNRYMDRILAVSRRTADIAVSFGVTREKVAVSYIGSEVAERQKGEGAYSYSGGAFHICYLGYMRKVKGFHFLIDALEKMPLQTAMKIKLTLAVKITDREMENRIKRLRERLAEITVFDGYTHQELLGILEHVQLGIVPYLWEDNLPQVAIEMKAYGIPVLASGLGGAKELTLCEEFCFNAGDEEDFIEKLSGFMAHPERLSHYWKGAPRLMTMEEHIKDLMAYYEG